MQYEDTVTIETPEGVDLSLTLAGLGSRFVAAVLDGLIQSSIMFAFILALGVAAGSSGEGSTALAVALTAVIAFLVVFGYHVLFETLNSGRSPGKAAAGIRVVRDGGRPITFGASAVRNLVRVVDSLPVGYGVGIVAILVSRKNQRLGDMAAGTLVIRDRKPEPGPGWVQSHAPASATGTSGWDVGGISEEEVATVRSFLARRYELTPAARAHLANELALRLRPKVAGPDPSLPPEQFLEQVAATKSGRA